MDWWNTENSGAVELFCVLAQWRIYIIKYLSKLVDCRTPGMNPHINNGLRVTMACLCRCTDCNESFTVVREADNGGRYACIVQVVHGVLYFLLNFSVNLKFSKDEVYYK